MNGIIYLKMDIIYNLVAIHSVRHPKVPSILKQQLVNQCSIMYNCAQLNPKKTTLCTAQKSAQLRKKVPEFRHFAQCAMAKWLLGAYFARNINSRFHENLIPRK